MKRSELQYALLGASAVMLLTCVPYLIVWFYTPLDAVFPWILFNSDDHGVYFAWIRQARDGNLLFRNLFTTEPQRGFYLHVYFLALGGLSRITGMDVALTYHLGRLVTGAAALVLVYRLGAFFTADLRTRRCIFWTTALSGGLGWLFWADQVRQSEPVDVWQPEALTFPSLYTNGLFCVSLALMLGVVICLLLAAERGPRWAVLAGVCGLLLGNIHSYDMIHLSVVWGAYLLGRWVTMQKFPARELGHALIAALVAAPSVAYMAWLYVAEPVFRARADTATWSRSPLLYLLGYGLLVPLAVWGAAILWPKKSVSEGHLEAEYRIRCLLPPIWAVAGLAVAYLPFAFQRKMIMGEHLALSLLAGIAVARIGRAVADRTRRPWTAAATAVLVISALTPSSLLYLVRDVRVTFTKGVTSTGIHPVYWPSEQFHAFAWLERSTPANAALFLYPTNGVLAPAYTGRRVYAGHWGETPAFQERCTEAAAYFRGRWSGDERRDFLRSRGITHVLVGPTERMLIDEGVRRSRGRSPEQDAFLRPVFSQGETVLYEVVRDGLSNSAIPANFLIGRQYGTATATERARTVPTPREGLRHGKDEDTAAAQRRAPDYPGRGQRG